MKAFVIICTLITSSCMHLYGQSDVLMSEEIDAQNSENILTIVSLDTGGVAFLTKKETKYSLYLLSKDLKLVKNYDLDRLADKGKATAVTLVKFGNGLSVIYANYDDDLNAHDVYAKTLETGTMKMGEPRVIASFPVRRANQGEFQFTISQDGSKMLIYYEARTSKNSGQLIQFSILNEAFSEVRKRHYIHSLKSPTFVESDLMVLNDGTVLICGIDFIRYRDVNSKVHDNPLVYRAKVFTFSGVDEKPEVSEIIIENQFVQQMRLVSDGVSVICAGVTSKHNSYGFTGWFTSRLNQATGKFGQLVTSDFEPDFIASVKDSAMFSYSTKSRTYKMPAIFHHKIHTDVLVDGSVYLLFEEVKEVHVDHMNDYSFGSALGDMSNSQNSDVMKSNMYTQGYTRNGNYIARIGNSLILKIDGSQIAEQKIIQKWSKENGNVRRPQSMVLDFYSNEIVSFYYLEASSLYEVPFFNSTEYTPELRYESRDTDMWQTQTPEFKSDMSKGTIIYKKRSDAFHIIHILPK